jgi:hypothetical protein
MARRCVRRCGTERLIPIRAAIVSRRFDGL